MRVILLLFALTFVLRLSAAPGNDLCGGPSSLSATTSCSGTVNGTLFQATYSAGPTSTCTGSAFIDVWYTFSVPAGITSMSFSLSSLGTGLTTANTYVEVFDARNCAGVIAANSLGCANAATGLTLNSLSPSTVYYLRVFTTANPGTTAKGNFSVCASYTPPPANDECNAATTLTVGTIDNTGSVWLATASPSIPVDCATGTPDDDVWYSFTATSGTAYVSLSAIGANLTAAGAMIQVFSGSCGTLKTIACGTTNVSLSSLVVGDPYYIRVYSGTSGSIGGVPSGSAFSILVSVIPGNDECANAYLLPTSTSCLNSEGTVVGATASQSVPIGACTGSPNDDVWYKFVATKAAPTITLSSIGANLSSSGSRIQLLSGSCGSLASVACGTTSIAASGLTVGNTYFLRVYSSGGTAITSAGNFNICVTNPLPDIVTDSTTTLFNIDTIGKNLGFPWEVTYGPDDSLWITEARGYRVLRMSASRTQSQKNIAPQQVLKIPLGGSLVSFDRTVGTWPQGGMEGLAIHPEFMTNPAKRWVYIAYVYSGTCPASPGSTPCVFRSKIVRCQFYFAADAGNPTSIPKRDTLVILDTIISNLPGSNDHNSGRLKIGPTLEGSGTPTYKLYYTIGDMGAGQFNNATRTNNAQNKDTCEGKILRLNTEPDGDPSYGITHDYNTWRQWIPNDNPFTHSLYPTLPTPIYSYGHRNAQGLAWGNVNGTWRLYSSEHGDHSDDEVNIIEAGKNYGWPKVAGMADDNYNTYDDLSDGFTFNNVLANQNVTSEIAWANANSANYKNPIFDFFNWNGAQIEPSNTGNIFNWPTIAPSSIDFYNGAIPGWKNSLIVTSLKYGAFRLKLNANGDGIDSTSSNIAVDTFPLLHGWRVRDIAINPNPISGKIWAVIDSSGSTSGPTGGFNGGNSATKDGGKILLLTYKTMLTLPVHFVSFTGNLLTDRTILLNWVAETDEQHNYFDVEKNINSSWVTLGRVAKGSPNRFIDGAPLSGDNYFRLKQVDLDGKVNYSKVIDVRYGAADYIVTTYPNPVKDVINLKIASPKQGTLLIRLMDMQGKVIYSRKQNVDNGSVDLPIPCKGLPSQLYLLTVSEENGSPVYSQKLMKE
jgi:PQQ-dependent dehydrogenase (s-GDH family)